MAALAFAPARAEVTQFSLRFDRAVYRVGSCAQLLLDAPALTGLGGAPSTVQLAVIRGASASGSVLVPTKEIPGRPGLFQTTCIDLPPTVAQSNQSSLPVQVGDTLAALAVAAGGQPIAAAVAAIGGAVGSGRFRPVVDSSLATSADGQSSADGAVADANGRPTRFALGRVILRAERPGDLDAFLTRRNGRLLGTRITQSVDRREGVPPTAAFHLVEVDATTADLDGFAALVERWTDAEGELRFSSSEAVSLMALVLEEQAAGRFVEPDVLLEASAVPASNEGVTGFTVVDDFFQMGLYDPSKNPTELWFNPLLGSPGHQQLRLGEGLALAQIVVKPQPPVSPVQLAIIDQGFAGPGDYQPLPFDNPDYGRPFASIPQCSINDAGSADCSPGSAAGPNTSNSCDLSLPECVWHGTAAFSAAAAGLHNGFGAAGTGSPAAVPSVFNTASNSFAAGSAMYEAMNPPSGAPASVINASFSIQCQQLEVLNICDPITNAILVDTTCLLLGPALTVLFPALVFSPTLCPWLIPLAGLATHIAFMEQAVDDAWARGAVIVASAGNEDLDVDDAIVRPCMLDHVICVSSATISSSGTVVSIARRGYGASIDVWAPEGTFVTPVPPNAGGLPSRFGGTSNATPLVAGALATVRAIDPVLTPDGVANLLRGSTCATAQAARSDGTTCIPSADPRIAGRGYLDYLELVRAARRSAGKDPLLPCTGGWDADEREPPQGDDGGTAIPIPTLDPVLGYVTGYAGSGDLSIHELRKLNLTEDEDWYHFAFTPDPTESDVLVFLVEARVRVPDPALGALKVDLFSIDSTGAPQPEIAMWDVASFTGDALTYVFLRTDRDYLARVTVATAPDLHDTNCYTSIELKVVEFLHKVPRGEEP